MPITREGAVGGYLNLDGVAQAIANPEEHQ
jgi:hypothetical protein